jgi:cytochrome c oxidase assembly protein Cox11
MKQEINKKITLPIALIICCLILGIFYVSFPIYEEMKRVNQENSKLKEEELKRKCRDTKEIKDLKMRKLTGTTTEERAIQNFTLLTEEGKIYDKCISEKGVGY